jgi:hypothetical protein
MLAAFSAEGMLRTWFSGLTCIGNANAPGCTQYVAGKGTSSRSGEFGHSEWHALVGQTTRLNG